jgi:hypothetical protein
MSTDKTEGCIATLLSIVIGVPAWFANGWVGAKLWAWFAVPLLGAPPVGMFGIMGLGVLAGIFTPSRNHLAQEEDAAKIAYRSIAGSLLRPALALAFGALVRSWL